MTPIIVCRSVQNYIERGAAVPSDAILRRCDACGHPVAIGALGQEQMKLPGARILCTKCGLIAVASMPVAEVVESDDIKRAVAASSDARATKEMFDELIARKRGKS